jgi:hypothetical protein
LFARTTPPRSIVAAPRREMLDCDRVVGTVEVQFLSGRYLIDGGVIALGWLIAARRIERRE